MMILACTTEPMLDLSPGGLIENVDPVNRGCSAPSIGYPRLGTNEAKGP